MNDDHIKKEKVVLFPGVVDKLVTKGMDALKDKRFEDAFHHFEQALSIEPKHPQGRFGVALSLIEQNKLIEAKNVTEQMLKEDIGDYYEILKVHISLLVQLGLYDEVVMMLEAIIAEEKLPSNMAESFYHLLHFSRQMVDDIGLEIERDPLEIEEIVQSLHNGTMENQWLAIQKLGNKLTEDVTEAFQQFLNNEKQDPVLKSIILQVLKDKNFANPVQIQKLGKIISVVPSELDDVFHKKFGEDTLKTLDDHLGIENPSLYQMISQVWWHYLFVLFPTTPEPLHTRYWAAVLHGAALKMSGEIVPFDELSERYEVDGTNLNKNVTDIISTEMNSYRANT